MSHKSILAFVLSLISILLFSSCKDTNGEEAVKVSTEPELVSEEELDFSDWTEETHGNDVDPNYEVVFPDDEVLRLDITISAANWSAMQSNLDANLETTVRGPGGGGGADVDFTPIWIPGTIEFEGKQWYQVGIRYKGNSTLKNAYQGNTDKYPFKLDFDEYEDTYEQLKNQRFYGFKQLNLSNNFDDNSFMREKLASDLFREFGVPSAHASFCAVYLDRGNGSTFIGIYTIVEEVDDTVYETQFADGDGNLYKPDGDAATFASSTYDEEEFDLKTNEDEANFSDVKTLYDLMQSDERSSNPDKWIGELEAVFDVDQFLKYLAVNNVIQNWDTYGVMTHNYFLYNYLGKLVWIPWDNNESMQDGKMGGALSLSMSEVGSDWPLISYIMDVEAYENQYRIYVEDFTNNHFQTSQLNALISGYEALLGSLAEQETSAFSSAILTLKNHVQNRNNEVNSFIN